MNHTSNPSSLHPKAREGIDLFNQREFYNAHDPLEEAWMLTSTPERDLYQGILQIGLAYFQISRGNTRGALKMFKRGHKNLSLLGDRFLGINIAKLRADADAVESFLRESGVEETNQHLDNLVSPIQSQAK